MMSFIFVYFFEPCPFVNDKRGRSNRDGGANSPSNDPLHGIGGPMTRSKTKRMKQALQGLILKIKEKEDQCELRATPNWVTLLQINENALRLT